MDKKISVISIAFIIGMLFLTGCTSLPKAIDATPIYSNYIELTDLNVETRWGDCTCERYQEACILEETPENTSVMLWLSGNVTNIGNNPIKAVSLNIDYLDDSGNILCTRQENLSDISINSKEEFLNIISNGEGLLSCKSFDNVSDYKITITKLIIDIF